MHPDTSILTNISEGIAKLGVGANMVKSIKYWATLANIVCYDSREKRYVLTRLGNIIAHYDIYLEDAFTCYGLFILEITNFLKSNNMEFILERIPKQNFSRPKKFIQH